MNSRTSRPRSPIKAITLMSASSALRAIMPNKEDLPTPAPAKIPILCPLATVSIPSIQRTPVDKIVRNLARCNGSGGALKIG
ncbi:Uncharacterised protein [Chlamydia trachomatis]|nr:Uncharacterised protein [Chlamydia trachomatis]CRH67481.1 Uncharacterised protein [Chlamydia trachomatis]CRH87809.1 Uncharacterised protein [Chlamydia trachomatis]CRI74743.1 Uncharacterised protein [Chlamydia trachomatis]